jgi:hypothetical protein
VLLRSILEVRSPAPNDIFVMQRPCSMTKLSSTCAGLRPSLVAPIQQQEAPMKTTTRATRADRSTRLTMAVTGTALACALGLTLSACGGGGSDSDSSTTASTSTSTTGSTGTTTGNASGLTATVLCSLNSSVFNSSASVNATSTANWSCNGSSRVLAANGLPDHAVGTFPNPNNPNAISAQNVAASITLAPTLGTAATQLGGPTGNTGYMLNGVKIDAGTAGSCDNSGSNCSLIGNSGSWAIEALGQSSFNFGTDSNNAHVQPGGTYHYHGMPEGYITRLGKGTAVTLIGWAADGFPIYARYGYASAGDAASAVRVLKSSYRLKTTPDAGRPATSLYAMGAFRQDYEYVAGLGDLDECNGRTGVTPEFPAGIYHYYATDTYPYLQRCVKGKL